MGYAKICEEIKRAQVPGTSEKKEKE